MNRRIRLGQYKAALFLKSRACKRRLHAMKLMVAEDHEQNGITQDHPQASLEPTLELQITATIKNIPA
ncbi:hypothetical protein [Candidatus Nitrotoga fabula]|uniref:hypothetical protein n=1 Tax=Candidatus Nitrotoga fabula TaxID=2182327 RepID=UPI001BB47D5E|nr:hypothetical protein [Candidatus Nitrotoga fabula]